MSGSSGIKDELVSLVDNFYILLGKRRYYSVTLVLISVIDGFVNDIDKARRRGLHTRTPEEMHTEDCVATMWPGLPEVQKRFVRSFNARCAGSNPASDTSKQIKGS